MKRGLWGSLLILGLLVPIVSTAAPPFRAMVVFGDSLSDAGNLASLPGFEFLNRPPFDRGVSNGPRAVEVLAASLGLELQPSLHLVGAPVGTNFAVIGARARGSRPIDLPAQIGVFLLNNRGMALADALYIVFIGGNDVRDARDELDEPLAEGIIEEAVSTIEWSIRTLLAAGAKAMIVINVPDLGIAPETRQLGDEEFSVRATRLSQRFNTRLSERVHQIEDELGFDLIEFNLFEFFRFVIENSLALGFTNNKEACFSSLSLVLAEQCDFERFVFFDELHPTKRTHERVGRALFAVVPEPVEMRSIEIPFSVPWSFNRPRWVR